jgi:5S rRNA maturation endonuclease (ribonuclease M5)
MNINEFIKKFSSAKKKNGQYRVKCPAHDDETASLSVKEGSDGRILLKCFAGCTADEIVKKMGLTQADLFPERKKLKDIIYQYHDKNGELIYEVVKRIESGKKNFKLRKPKNGRWDWSVSGSLKTLYRLPEVIKAAKVFIVEGEKDVETLRNYKIVATTATGGANKTSWKSEFDEFFRDKEVVVLPDNDPVGKRYANHVATSVASIAKSIKIVALPGLPKKGDVSDWLLDHSKKELLDIVENTEEYGKAKPFKLISFADKPPTPTKWIIRDMLAEETCMLCSAEEKTGKSWFLFDLAICLANSIRVLDKYRSEKTGKIILYSPESSINAKSLRLWGLSHGHGLDPREALKNVLFLDDRLDLNSTE